MRSAGGLQNELMNPVGELFAKAQYQSQAGTRTFNLATSFMQSLSFLASEFRLRWIAMQGMSINHD